MDHRAQHHRHRVLPVAAGGDAVGVLESAGEGLMGGKAIAQSDGEQTVLRVPHVPQGKGQPPPPQIVPQLHAGNAPEHMGHMVLRVSQLLRQMPQGQPLVLLRPDAAVDLLHQLLNVFPPRKHGSLLLLTALSIPPPQPPRLILLALFAPWQSAPAPTHILSFPCRAAPMCAAAR